MIYLSKKEFSELHRKCGVPTPYEVALLSTYWWLRRDNPHNIESEYQKYRKDPTDTGFYNGLGRKDSDFVKMVIEKHELINKLHLLKQAIDL